MCFWPNPLNSQRPCNGPETPCDHRQGSATASSPTFSETGHFSNPKTFADGKTFGFDAGAAKHVFLLLSSWVAMESNGNSWFGFLLFPCLLQGACMDSCLPGSLLQFHCFLHDAISAGWPSRACVTVVLLCFTCHSLRAFGTVKYAQL